MGGFFGTVSQRACVTDLFYGTDYNSHLGTKRGGLATYSKEQGFIRSIHNLESSYFLPSLNPIWINSKAMPGSASSATQTHNLSLSILISGASPSLQSQKSSTFKN